MEMLQIIERMSARLILTFFSAVVGIVASTVFVTDHQQLFGFVGPNFPYWPIMALPLAVYTILYMNLTLTPHYFASFAYSVKTKNVHTLDKFKDFLGTLQDFSAEKHKLTVLVDNAQRVIERDANQLTELSRERDKMLEKPGHILFSSIIFRFSILVTLVHYEVGVVPFVAAALLLHARMIGTVFHALFGVVRVAAKGFEIWWICFIGQLLLKEGIKHKDVQGQSFKLKFASFFAKRMQKVDESS